MTQHTLELLHQLKLSGMAAEFERQLANPTSGELPFEHRLRVMAEQELTFRDHKRLQVLLKRAKLQANASIEAIDYRANRGLDKAQMLSLTTLRWVEQQTNLVITGPSGTGKTWLACALGNHACRMGLSTHFIRIPILLDDLLSARATNLFHKRITQLAKFDLLILDDWGMESYSERAQHDLFELIDARASVHSTIMTSQYPLEKWHDKFDNKTVADAILDRIVHSSHMLKLSGDSLRRRGRPKLSAD